ncbi:hypothetical protein FKM82_022922 [Ascaphus truei]
MKHCHAAATTCILEAVKHNADRSTLSTFLEDCKFDKERTEQFWTEYQKNKDSLEILLERVPIPARTQILVLIVLWNKCRI